jgi:hypothetical protein
MLTNILNKITIFRFNDLHFSAGNQNAFSHNFQEESIYHSIVWSPEKNSNDTIKKH